MGDIVNLRKARKQTARQHQEQRAAENRIVYGRSKAERMLEQARREKNGRLIDQHLLKPDHEP
jgi:isocitrate dehydrogenase kinase/phosphatase